MYSYVLTNLTGRRKNDDRSMVVASFEVNRYTFIVVILSLLASIIPTSVLALFLSPFGGAVGAGALLLPPVFVMGGLALWDQRTSKGLQLRRYAAMWDKQKARRGGGGSTSQGVTKPQEFATIYVCSQPLEEPVMHTLVQTVIPNFNYTPGVDDGDLYDTTERTSGVTVGIGKSTKRSAPADRSFLE